MKINSTFTIVSLIFLGILGVGGTSGLLAYKFGTESLKAVQFPSENPAQKLAKNNPSLQKSSPGFQLMKEKNILVKVYDYIYHQKEAMKKKKSEPKQSSTSKDKKEITAQDSSSRLQSEKFVDLKGKDQGVSINVVKISQKQTSLLLAVNLQNNSQKNVKFLYSFLDIQDDQDRKINAITNGLPMELPANGQNFSGEISIPLSLLSDSRKISLTLPNYPEQNLLLQIPDIPILK